MGPELPDEERIEDLCWLPDGKSVTYVDVKSRFHTLAVNGGRNLWLDANLAGQRGVSLGGYSPDGNWLVIWTDTGLQDMNQERDIWLLPHHGGRGVPLVQRPGFDGFATWGADGQTIYFVSGDGGIWKVRIDPKTGLRKGDSSAVFTKPDQSIFHPKIVANGQRLLYVVDEPNTRIWVAESDRRDQATQVLRGQHPVLSPDGATLYYVDEPEPSGIFAFDRHGRNAARKITTLVPLGRLSASSLSPDGASLAMRSSDGKRLGVFIVPTAGGAARLIEELAEPEAIHPTWSPDGQWLTYAIDKTLYRVSRDGKVREPLATLYRWLGGEWSPDGKHIAALAYEKPEEWEDKIGVFVVSVVDKTWKKVSPNSEDKYKGGLEWHPDSQRLTYQFEGPEPRSATIMMAFLNGGPTKPLIRLADHWLDFGVWSPDGRQFSFHGSLRSEAGKRIHIYDAPTEQITHAVRAGSLPQWSRDGKTQVWTQRGESLRRFEVIENFR